MPLMFVSSNSSMRSVGVMFSGSTRRFVGVRRVIVDSCSVPSTELISEAKKPGAIELTRNRPCISRASERVAASRPPFVAEYATRPA